MTSNLNIRRRGTPSRSDIKRILVFAPDPVVTGWVDLELRDQATTLQLARSVREVVAALVVDPPPRPQILVADLDAMSGADVLELHAIRERGWFGTLIALGTVSDALIMSLNVETGLARPLLDESLRRAIGHVGLDKPTTKMVKLEPPERR